MATDWLQCKEGVNNCLTFPTGVVRTVAGGGKAHVGGHKDCVDSKTTAMDGIGTNARFNYPWGIEFDSEENVLYVADCVSIHRGFYVDYCTI